MPNRQRPPERRDITTFKFKHETGTSTRRFLASVSYFEDNRPAELFINTDMRSGSESDTDISDAAVAISLALQYGCPLDTLREAMKRNEDGSPTGPMAHVLDIVATMDPDAPHMVATQPVPGDVIDKQGNILLPDGSRLARGFVFVTQKQAERAAEHGWYLRTERDGDLVAIDRG